MSRSARTDAAVGEVRVVALSSTPVKGLRIVRREALELEADGARGDRLMYLVDGEGRLVNGKRAGSLQQVIGELDAEGSTLTLAFPDGARVSGAITLGEQIETTFFSARRAARLLPDELSRALSEHAGEHLRLVAPADGSNAIDRGASGAVSLVSHGSVEALRGLAGVERLDARRFRMSIEVAGAEPFAEDGWIGVPLAIGAAEIVLGGHVGRCLVTARDPDSGARDLPTLELLRELRGDAATSEPLALGVFGEVRRPGAVRIGDRVRAVAP